MISWGGYPPRPTVWPPIEVPPFGVAERDVVERDVDESVAEQVRRRVEGAERRRQEMGAPTRTIVFDG